MSRRSGQKGSVVKKGTMWHVRYYVDVPNQDERERKSVAVGPCVGAQKLTKSEAQRKGTEIIAALGVNTEEHLQRATNPNPITFKQHVKWCRENRSAWLEGKPGPIRTMESQLEKHILPRFGDLLLESVDETAVQEFISDLKRRTFERKNKKGDVVKRYKLSRKTILNIVGVVKLVLGKKVWGLWELDYGRPVNAVQPYFTDEQLTKIIEAAEGQYKVLFAVLAGTGMRIGEAAGLYVEDVDLEHGVISVRRAVWNGIEQTPKTGAGVREIDIASELATLLREYIGTRKDGRLFKARNGSPLSANNVLKRVLHPILAKLGLPKSGRLLHAFRHSRVTALRKAGTPEDLQKQWIGHTSLTTTDRYSHTDQELEYRRQMANQVGLNFKLDPMDPTVNVEELLASA
ncbi:MAG TPA: tyrosine-type recombinase/integrase [Candidatus Eisenbacteria bacterium]|nr:tyrosine-type recombinase/integrase [Candidatus Eisenbacteria bacterium]